VSDETPDVRELTLTKLGVGGAEATLTLSEDKLTVETPDDSPLPAWMRGEIAFAELDIAYINPDQQRAQAEVDEEDEEEAEEESQVSPGFRISRWIEITEEGTGRTFDRRAHFMCDEGHVDLAVAEPFALTFLRLAGRPLPEEKAEAPVAEVAEAEAPGAEPSPAPEPVDETPAFAGSDAFAAPDDDEPRDKAFV
jgi:hypothetical protein